MGDRRIIQLSFVLFIDCTHLNAKVVDVRGAMDHPESDYVKRVLGEPLKDALSAVVLYQPLDPIEFLANYLKYWAIKVRDHRCVSDPKRARVYL